MDLKLQGKRALVTGASQGLGFATARGLALEGCSVAISSRSVDKLNSAARNLEREAQTRRGANHPMGHHLERMK